ncbi:hypothetical protein Verru16b_03252 [Lacunisphaera limnophila]|uniref:Polyketide cyclase / dehydrase and lipid transport n=1 Tax=Lacunisphaera limnophila TaxID=1838286 RepID=A0A1D8AZ51_9BACT|nr:SRPBCC family protein [Lacunisphaera limnophila]AOS46155.1 hypothetical protein Verru16b_03252 [Lacunisphaera limnophila]
MPRIELELLIRAPIQIVFDLARSIDAHQASQSQHAERAVAGRTTGLIQLGESVTWEAVHLGVRQRLTSRIVAMTAPLHFRDSMVAGAFRRFDHDHLFATVPGGTRMSDVFDYTAPLGRLGRLADRLFLQRYMTRLLAARNQTLKQLAESGDFARYLPPPSSGKI